MPNRNTVQRLLPVAILLIVSAAVTISQRAFARDNYNRFLTLYDGLLRAHIRPAEKNGIAYNGVNYDSWAADPRHKNGLALLLAETPDAHTAAREKMAFWINVYNFLTIDLIVREGERRSIRNLGTVFASAWKLYTWRLAGREYSLDEIEHRILRPMGDPRIHFAINCASVSCPDLRTKAYRSTKLGAQLDDQVRTTLRNAGKGLRIDKGTIYASKIFEWFAEDFSGGDVRSWLRQYAPIRADTSVKFLRYDWSINTAD